MSKQMSTKGSFSRGDEKNRQRIRKAAEKAKAEGMSFEEFLHQEVLKLQNKVPVAAEVYEEEVPNFVKDFIEAKSSAKLEKYASMTDEEFMNMSEAEHDEYSKLMEPVMEGYLRTLDTIGFPDTEE